MFFVGRPFGRPYLRPARRVRGGTLTRFPDSRGRPASVATGPLRFLLRYRTRRNISVPAFADVRLTLWQVARRSSLARNIPSLETRPVNDRSTPSATARAALRRP